MISIQPSFVLMLAFIANGMAYSFFVITLPVIGRQLQFSDGNTGLILSLSALVITIVSPIWGKVCDSWGRRWIIVIGMVATTLFTLITGLIIYYRLQGLLLINSAFALLLFTRLLNALLTGGLKPGGQAYIADTTSTSDRTKGMGMMGAGFGIGSVVGGISAMLSGSDDIVTAYMGISLAVLISSLLVFFYLPETPFKKPIKQEKTKSPIPYARLWFFLLVTLLGLTVFSSLQHIVGLSLQDHFGLSADKSIRVSGMTMMLMMLTMIVTQLFLIRTLPLRPKQFILYGLSIAVISLTVAAITPLMPLFILAISLFGLSLGLLLPGNLAALTLVANEQVQARVAGINGIGQGLGLALGPVLGITLYKINLSFPYFFSALLMIVLLILLRLATFSTEE